MSEAGFAGWIAAVVALYVLVRAARARLLLSRAKHRSLQGHPKMAKHLARLLPFYEFGPKRFFDADGAPADIAARRRAGLDRLAQLFEQRSPATLAYHRMASSISDLRFTNAYRVPFQFRSHVARNLRVDPVMQTSSGVHVQDLDGAWSYDLSGSYGVNLFGYDYYKECINAGLTMVRDLGPVLGPYHPVIEDNVRKLREISGLDEVSFHMSGTEAVMQAVRLARFHTRRSHLVRFCGAYHGWWDGVQPGVGNTRKVDDVYTLADLSERSLRVLDTRHDIACVLINPFQALH